MSDTLRAAMEQIQTLNAGKDCDIAWLCKQALAEETRGCPHVYESDCHGIEMIKSPSGKEWAIGGTNTRDRWSHDPWCGRPTNAGEEVSDE